uniref:Uncharacterized protein n=1 Tax=Zea mays TaxID=4577 RepID=C0PAW2_MAIZE|nr:unknown [Zea mays]
MQRNATQRSVLTSPSRASASPLCKTDRFPQNRQGKRIGSASACLHYTTASLHSTGYSSTAKPRRYIEYSTTSWGEREDQAHAHWLAHTLGHWRLQINKQMQ